MRAGRPGRDSLQATSLGTVLARRRTSAGLSRAALAARAGLSVNTLMKVEQGQTRDPGVFKVAAVCRALSLPIDEVVESAKRPAGNEEVGMTYGIVSAGYEGRTIDEFITALEALGVQTVADVRLNATSRKAGFSKNRLRNALAAAGIDYRHMRELGNAKDNREPFWTGRVEEGRRVFRAALRTPAAEASLSELGDLAADHVVAVLCFEADPEHCHRQVVIDEVVGARDIPVTGIRR